MELRIAGTVGESIVDGPGFRFTILRRAVHTAVRVVTIRRHMILMVALSLTQTGFTMR